VIVCNAPAFFLTTSREKIFNSRSSRPRLAWREMGLVSLSAMTLVKANGGQLTFATKHA